MRAWSLRLVALLRSLVWLVVAALISLGAGGVVASADHPATDEARPELTARGDARMAGGLAVIARQLQELEPEVADLGDTGRRALISLAARDTDALARELVVGDGIVARIEQRATQIAGLVAALPHRPGSERISRATNRRLATVQRALRTVSPLRASWHDLARAAEPATRLVVLLEDHDRQTATATSSGTKGEYAAALQSLTVSIADLDAATGIRDELASRADVATLDEWIERGRGYDEALVVLYTALDASNGVVTPAARRAFADVERAQQALPLDTRALVIIMGDIAQGGLNQVVISIEQARGDLAAAIAALH